jgi:hypothetical protein
MQIVLILLLLATAVLAVLVALLVGSLALGGLLLIFKPVRVLAPLFLLVVPAAVLGSLAGGVFVGYSAFKYDENLVFLGPLGGLVLGGIAGGALGLLGAMLWWWLAARRASRGIERDHLPQA